MKETVVSKTILLILFRTSQMLFLARIDLFWMLGSIASKPRRIPLGLTSAMSSESVSVYRRDVFFFFLFLFLFSSLSSSGSPSSPYAGASSFFSCSGPPSSSFSLSASSSKSLAIWSILLGAEWSNSSTGPSSSIDSQTLGLSSITASHALASHSDISLSDTPISRCQTAIPALAAIDFTLRGLFRTIDITECIRVGTESFFLQYADTVEAILIFSSSVNWPSSAVAADCVAVVDSTCGLIALLELK
mmetsp:Transcript_2896/g.4414  ORF Transcript_2896/g.4414 Transcript_2896/m.4414 type:complete len:247 (+) Transcript_2896:550-1290(+)